MQTMDEVVCLNHHVVVKRQEFSKIVKITEKSFEVRLGQDTIDLSNVVGRRYQTFYKLDRKLKKAFTLTPIEETVPISGAILDNCVSGVDNRGINDDGSSQKMSTDDVMELKASGASAEEIVKTLIKNSKTFASKTEYAQEKYVKKKEKKYVEVIEIYKPTVRLIANCVLGKNKALGLRFDTFAQLMTLGCVRSGGTYLLYETGCQGLVSAAVLNAIGSDGTIIHVHNGNTPEKQALMFLDFPQERLDQILHVSIFNLLRKFEKETSQESNVVSEKAFIEEEHDNQCGEPLPKRARWETREDRAIEILRTRLVDGLLVVSREHPANIICHLLKYLHPARSFVVFSATREPLLNVFLQLKSDASAQVTALRLTENFLRTHQVLPDRTHPDVLMSGCSGYLLSGIKVSP